ncbi:MAG: hypothetical protein FWD59_03255 [Micrococcales bacterium]|nr:hypothetical protein [Micrococcales bacterium]
MSWRSNAGLAALAVALLAGCTGGDSPPGQPLATVSSTETDVARVLRRDFQIVYELEATTDESSGVVLSAPRGTVLTSVVPPESSVSVGTVVARLGIDSVFRAELAKSALTSRIDASALRSLDETPREFAAPIAGVFELEGADARIVARGIDVVTPLTGVQELRLSRVSLTGYATVETIVGQRTVKCSFTWIAREGEEDSATGGPIFRCRLPRTLETVGGLRARLRIVGPLLPSATLVPDSMLGTDDSGYSVTVLKDGEPKTIAVEVGPSDGVVRVVTTPLPIGAELVPPTESP